MNLISVINSCNLFNGLCLETIGILYLVNLLFSKAIFIHISLVLLLEISNRCVSGVATEIYIIFILLHIYYTKNVFLHISFFKKWTLSVI